MRRKSPPLVVRTQDWKYVDAIYYRGVKWPMSLFGYQELYDERTARAENYSVAEVHPQIAKARFQQIEHLRFRPVHHKISSRQQHVVKQGRARARTPQHENRRLAARTRPRGFV